MSSRTSCALATLMFVTFVSLLPRPAWADTYHFMGDIVGAWDNVDNWTEGALPPAGSDIVNYSFGVWMNTPGNVIGSFDTKGLQMYGEPLMINGDIRLRWNTSGFFSEPVSTNVDFLNSITFGGNVSIHQDDPVFSTGTSYVTTWHERMHAAGITMTAVCRDMQFEGNTQFDGELYVYQEPYRRGYIYLNSGDTFADTGTIRLNSGTRLTLQGDGERLGTVTGSGTIYLTGHDLEMVSNENGSFAGTIYGNGGTLVKGGSGRYLASSLDNVNLQVNSGCLAVNPQQLLVGSSIANEGELELVGDGSGMLMTTVTGGGMLTKTGTGDLRIPFNIVQSTGGVRVMGGSISTMGMNALSSSTDLYVGGGATFNVGAEQTLRQLSGAGTINTGGGGLTVTGGGEFSGPIVGGGNLTVSNNWLTLSGNVDLAYVQVSSGGISFRGANVATDINVGPLASAAYFSGSGTTTLSGSVSGGGDVVIFDTKKLVLQGQMDVDECTVAGTLELGRNDAISSGTRLTLNGTLDLAGHSQTLGALDGPGQLKLSEGTLTLAPMMDSLIGASITGSGTVIKTGGSKLTLTGANSFANLNIQSGTVEGSVASVCGQVNNGGTLIINESGLGTLNATISGSGQFHKTGNGILGIGTRQYYIGATVVEQGLLAAYCTNGLPVDTDVTIQGGASLLVVSQSLRSISGAGALGLAGDLTLTGSADTVYSGQITGGGNLIKTGGGKLTLTNNNVYSGKTIIRAGTLEIFADNSVGDAPPNLLSDSLTLDGAGLRVSGNVNLAPTRGLSIGSGGASFNVVGSSTVLNVGGPVSGLSDLTKIGSGTLALNGSGTYLGATFVQAGKLAVSGGNAIPNTSAVSLTDAAGVTLQLLADEEIGSLEGTGSMGSAVDLGSNTLTVGGNNASTSFGGPVSGSGGKLVKTGTGAFTLSGGGKTYSGGTTVLSGALKGDTMSLQGNILNYSIVQFEQNSGGTYSGNLTGTGSLIKSGSGSLVLGGANTYTGATNINAGLVQTSGGNAVGNLSSVVLADVFGVTLKLGADEEVGSISSVGSAGGDIDLQGSTLTCGGNNESTTFGGVMTGAGGKLVKNGTGTLTLTRSKNYTGGTTVNGGVLKGDMLSLQGNIIDNANVEFNQASAGHYTGNLSGTGSVTKSGLYKLYFDGTNTFSGGMNITGGEVETNGQGIGDLSTLTTADVMSALLRVTWDEEIGAISGGGSFGGGIVFQFCNLTVGGNNQSTTFSGQLSGSSGVLIKKGTGTLTVNNTGNTYSGGTRVLGGTLAVSRDANMGAAAGTVLLDTGTLSVRGTSYTTTSRAMTMDTGGGTIEIYDAAATLTASGAITGTGGLAKTGPGTLVLAGSNYNTFSGTTTINAGTLALNKSSGYTALSGPVTLNAGTLRIDANNQTGNNVDLTVNGGTFNLNTKTLTLRSVTLNTSSDWSANGTLNANFFAGSNSSITANGPLTLGIAASYTGFRTGGLLTIGANTVTLNSKGFASLGALTSLANGTLAAPNGVMLGSGANLSGYGTVSGKISAGYGSTIEAVTGDLNLGDSNSYDGFFSDGSLLVGGRTVRLYDKNQAVLGSFTQMGSGGIGGYLVATNGLILNQGKNLVGFGTVAGAAGLITDGYVKGESTGLIFNLPVSGYGAFEGTVTFNSGFSPGHSPANVELENVNFGSGNTLTMELGGASAGSQYDQLTITGSASLDGTLSVSLINGYVPAAGSTFRLFDGTIGGTFATVSLPAVSGMRWDTSVLNSNGILGIYYNGDVTRDNLIDASDIDSVYRHFGSQAWWDLNSDSTVNQADVGYLLKNVLHKSYGDSDLNGKVDFADFQVLLDHWQNLGGWAAGDFTGDGTVDFADFQKLLDNWSPAGGSESSVPEPATLSLLALAGLAMLRRRR